MKLEDQVVSLELAKKLKEIGVVQESLFYYQGRQREFERSHGFVISYHRDLLGASDIQNISAFTVAELGQMLPDQVSVWRNGLECICSHDELGNLGQSVPSQYADTEADARAKMLIYLLEGKLV